MSNNEQDFQLNARETMEYDVVVVGGGPAGLSAAIRLKQLATENGTEISVVVLEKGSEPGAHILSGAVMDPKALQINAQNCVHCKTCDKTRRRTSSGSPPRVAAGRTTAACRAVSNLQL